MAEEFSLAELQIIEAAAEEMKALIRQRQDQGLTYEFRKSSDNPPGQLLRADKVVSITEPTVLDLARQSVIGQATAKFGNSKDITLHDLAADFDRMARATELKVAQDLGFYTPDTQP